MERLLGDIESDLVERKASAAHLDRICEAICAFANDLPGHRTDGVVFVGISDDGSPNEVQIDDRLLLNLAAIRTDGNIQPTPSMSVQKRRLRGADVAVIEVSPADAPPVHYRGRVYIRVGPRRAVATPQDERVLRERTVAGTRPFDQRGCAGASLDDLLLEPYRTLYLPQVVAKEILEANNRTLEDQMASLRLFDLRHGCPTHAAILAFGRDPLQFIPGALIQFVRFEGTTLSDPVLDSKEIGGNLLTQLQQVDLRLPVEIRTARRPVGGLRHRDFPDYPLAAIRETVLNAIMHRNYEGTSSKVQINWFEDRVEVQNPGGLYGHVTEQNFDRVSDCRNSVIAEIMKALGYVERFGTGISRVRRTLEENGNPPPEFHFEREFTRVTVRSAR
ncbi:MAG: ATP-binding protein [Bryobacteraceae bacterium]